MRWLLVLLAIEIAEIPAMDNLRVAYKWRKLAFDFPSETERMQAEASGAYIAENNVPLGLEVFGERLFITVPRWKGGVAASLAYINITSDPDDSPLLKPYPNWEAHKIRPGEPPGIVSPFRIRADRCGKLWVLDIGATDLLGNPSILVPARLLVYNLHNDALLRSYVIPEDQLKKASFLANIAVEEVGENCEDSFAYLGDVGKPAIIVYSWKSNTSWRLHHNYFDMDPLEGEFNVSNVVFQESDGVYGLALSKSDRDGFSTLFFHPLTSTSEFSVNTRYLRDESLAMNKSAIYGEFKLLGSRGVKGQSTVSFLDRKTDVLFYALVNLNAIACWRTTNPTYTMESQGRVYMSNVHMVYPNDIKVDANDNLWVLSDRMPLFMYSTLDWNEVNFRILTAPVADAIKGTACDRMLVVSPDMMEKIKPTGNEKRSTSTTNRAITALMIIAAVAIINFVI